MSAPTFVTADASPWPPRLFPPIEHTPCEAECHRMLCACPDALCVGFFDNACDHGRQLCEDCRPTCDGCLDDARGDSANGGALVAWVPVPVEHTVPADGDAVVCTACNEGSVLVDAGEEDPAARWDSCPVCGGSGSVAYAEAFLTGLGGAA